MATETKQYQWSVALVLAVMAIVGACGIVYEYALGFLGNNLIGSSHEALVMVMSFMIASMGLGAYLQSVLFKKNLLDKFLIIEIVLAVLGGLSIIAIYSSYAFFEGYKLHLYGYVSLMGVFIGAELPLIYRVNKECQEEHGVTLVPNLSKLMAIDYFGALLGGALFAYALIPNFSVDSIVLNLAYVNLGVSVIAFVYFFGLVKGKKMITGLLIASGLIIGTAHVFTEPIMGALEQRCYGAPIVYRANSPYQHLVVTRSTDDETRLYLNGQLQFSSRDEHIYHEHLVHTPMVLAEKRQRVLILGGGDGMALREVLKYEDVEEVTLVDLDPLMTQLFSQEPQFAELNDGAFLDARVYTMSGEGISPAGDLVVEMDTKLRERFISDDRYELATVQVLNVDADLFIRQVTGKYDVVIVDFPDPNKLELAKLYSVGFYQALQSRMHPHTIVSVQSTSPYHAEEVFMCIGQTMHTAGFTIAPFHQNVPSFKEWGWHLAWVGEQTPQQMLEKLRRSQLTVETKFLTREVMLTSFVFGKDRLRLTDIAANTAMRPVIYDYYKKSWRR